MPEQPRRTRSSSLSLPFPLKQRWRTPLESDAFIWSPPQRNGQVVVARCGHLVAGMEAADGRLIWQTSVALEDFDNKALLATPDAIVTASPVNNDSELLALSWDTGDILWRARLPGTVLEESPLISGGRLYTLTAEETAGDLVYTLHALDPLKGEMLGVTPAPPGAAHLLGVDDQLLLGSGTIWEEEAGLYLATQAPAEARRLLDAPVGRLRLARQAILAGIERDDDFELVALSRSDYEWVWSAPLFDFAFDADAGEVAHLEPAGSDKIRLVLRESGDGAVMWKTRTLKQAGVYLYFTGNAIGVQDEEGLNFFARENGRFLWRLESPEWTFSWGASATSEQFIVGHGSEVICYAAVDG